MSGSLKTTKRPLYTERNGDILEDYNDNSNILVQINNCVARKNQPGSFSWDLKQRYPYGNPYNDRKHGPYANLASVVFQPPPGTVKLILPPPGVTGPSIACCFAQYRSGDTKTFYYYGHKKTDKDYRRMSVTKDSYKHRLRYFNSCLEILTEKLINKSDIKKVIFPKFIGCGMARAIWFDYEEIISRFCHNLKIVRPDIVLSLIHI